MTDRPALAETPPPHWPRGLPARIHVPRITLWQQLETAALRFPDKPAIFFCENAITYAALRDQAARLAGHLQQHRVGRGDRVLLLSQNCPQFVVAFHAIVRAGGVVVPINAMSTAAEVSHYLADSGARVACVAQELLAAVAPALQDGRLAHAVVHTYSDALQQPPTQPVPDAVIAARLPLDLPRAVAWQTALADAPPPHEVDVRPTDLCLLPYTSGTTGHPKGCMHTHRTVLASTYGAALWRGLHAEAVVLAVAPLFHMLGLQNAMLMPLSQGATVVMLPRWDVAAAGRAIERYRVTTWAAPPAMLNDFFAHPETAQRDLRSLSMLNGGGAPMPQAVATLLRERFGISYVEGYGLTETASFLHGNPPGNGKTLSLGLPAFGVDSRIVDPVTLAPLPDGEVGELATHGEQLMLGYWNNPQANAAAFFERDGKRFFRTGDLACRDADGFFFMRERLKRMINVSGYKVWPAEVEGLLHQHPAVHEACVVAVPDARQGEAVRALVVCKPGAQVDAEGIAAWCRERLSAYKVPRSVVFRDALPKSETGKVQWRLLQEEAIAEVERATH
jgi:fatty-acyl-CoA synthase